MSADKPGERMICEMQQPLGTHLAKCTCWDEGLLADKRADTQEAFHEFQTVQTAPGHSTGESGR